MSETTVIHIPWFDRNCSPNAKNNNWRVKHRYRQKQKDQVYMLAQGIRKADQNKNIPLKINFHPPSRLNDLDNCLASIKGALDAIAKRMGVDDRQFRPITLDLMPPTKVPKIELIFRY